MANTFTRELYQGEPLAFEDFILRCARGLTYCIHQRDESLDHPPSPMTPRIDFYLERLKKVEDRLALARARTDAEWAALAEAEYAKQLEAHRAHETRRRAILERYFMMREEVLAWVPPTPAHQVLKTYALDMLAESEKYDGLEWPAPKPLDGETLKTQALDNAVRERANCLEDLDEEKLRCARVNHWIRTLYQSLGRPVPEGCVEG